MMVINEIHDLNSGEWHDSRLREHKPPPYDEAAEHAGVSTKTMRSWFSQWRQFDGFFEDMRGKRERDTELKRKFQIWMRTEAAKDSLSEDAAMVFLTMMLKDEEAITPGFIDHYGIKLPICRGTAHAWMHKSGGVKP